MRESFNDTSSQLYKDDITELVNILWKKLMDYYCCWRSDVIEVGTLMDRILVELHKDIDVIVPKMNTLEGYDFWESGTILGQNRDTQVISNQNNVLYPIKK